MSSQSFSHKRLVRCQGNGRPKKNSMENQLTNQPNHQLHSRIVLAARSQGFHHSAHSPRHIHIRHAGHIPQSSFANNSFWAEKGNFPFLRLTCLAPSRCKSLRKRDSLIGMMAYCSSTLVCLLEAHRLRN